MTASDDRTAKVWDAHTGILRATLEGHVHWVNVASFSPDGHSIVTGSRDRTARVWDAQTGAVRATLGGHKNGVLDASFSPDGSAIVTASGDGTARVWDAQTGALRTSLEGHAHAVYAASFSPDGLGIVTFSHDRTAKVWDPRTGGLRATLEGHTDAIRAASFSPDGRSIVTASMDGTARVWDAWTGALRATLAGNAAVVFTASFSPDGRSIVTASGDTDFESYLPGTARVWDAQTGALLASLEGHALAVFTASFSPDGRSIVTAGEDGTTSVWDAQPVALRVTLQGDGDLSHASFSPDGRTIMTSGGDLTARVWDAQTGALRTTIETNVANSVHGASFSPDGRAIVGLGTDGTVRVWDARTGAQRATLGGPDESGWRGYPIFSPDGQVILTTNEYDRLDESGEYDELPNIQFKVWDTQTGTLRASFEGHRGDVVDASFSLDGRSIVIASWGSPVRVWDAQTGTLRASLKGHTALVQAASFSPDGRAIVTASRDETAKVWDAHTGALRATLEGHTANVLAASFSPDGRSIVTAGSDGTAKVWDAHTGALRATLQTNTDGVRIASFSPNGSTIVVAGWGGMAQVWDAQTGALRAPLAGHTSNVEFVSFSPDGHSIVTACRDRTARVWDAQTGTLRATFEGTDGSVMGHYWDASRRTMSLIGQSGRIEHFRSDASMRITGKYAIDHFDVPDRAPTVLYYTPDGLFTGDEGAFDRVLYRLGPNVLHDDLVTADQLFDFFHRPSLVEDFWAGRPLTLHPDVAAGVGRPPRVELVNVPRGLVHEQVARVRVRAFSRGGGVAEVRLFNNGARVDTGTRGGLAVRRVESAEPSASPLDRLAFEQEFEVPLVPGENRLRAEAFSEIGRVRGERATATVRHEAPAVERPNLYLFAMGIDRYTDPRMTLDSAASDAQAVIGAFQRQRGRLFQDVHVTFLRDGDATLEGVVAALTQIAEQARPQDLFVMYSAGHGGMVQCPGEAAPSYRLLTHRASLQSVRNLCVEALSMDRLTGLLRSIHANKKLLILDACQSGGAAQEEVLLAMSAARGAEEVDAIRRLARSEGIAILAASKESEYAREVPALGHGVFTYALLQGLSGMAAARGEETVSVFSLIGYVDRTLPALARRYAGGEQRASTSLQGSDFPLYALRDGDEALVPAPADPASTGDGDPVLGAAARGEISAYIATNRGLLLDCLDQPGVVQASVDASGNVTFGLRGARAGTAAEVCVRQALGTLRVAPGAGEHREVVRP